MITHIVGISLSPSASIETGVAVLEVGTRNLIYLDKMFSMNDIQLFFNNYVSLKNSIIFVSLPWDNTMLDGKWRVLSKQYQLINSSNKSFPNKNNWMQRFSTRGCDLFLKLKENNIDILRYEIYLTRQSLNLYSNYKERSSADCKFLQSALKREYDFSVLPSNMLPVAQLEAIVGCILGEYYLQNRAESVFKFNNLEVINVKI